jgi:two-component system chemotaxis sensor kinase CheA
MDAVLKEFLAESAENLAQFERDLVGLERRPDAEETLAAAFRAIHSIKGATGFLGLSALGALAHAGESLLSALRDRHLPLSQPISNGLLELVDRIRQMLSEIESTGSDASIDPAALIAHLTALQAAQPAPTPRVSAPGPLRAVLATRPTYAAPLTLPPSRSVRVDVAQLDILMNLVGELVLTRNEMLQYSVLHQSPVLLSSSQRLNTITTQLQDGIMRARMQPIDNVWNTFPRIVRDIALACGKQVRLELRGKDTELDKTLLEAIKDPLTHVLRNCVAHGIESPERRLAGGKPAEGCISLRAFHEGGQVHIEVRDDGAGIDVEAIRRKALEGGLITKQQSEAMSDQEVTRLIFLPGLSTAAAVTSVSGRGVGMDVVKTNIERIGGKVSAQSEPGVGTIVQMRIPLTLAIMPGLIVTAGGERFAIPQVGVVELLRLGAGGPCVQNMGDAQVLRLRGEVLPLIRLDAALGVAPDTVSGAGECAAPNVVIVQAEDCRFGLIVDEVIDTLEVVVKPLDARLRAVPVFAGATILGDGCVALILDLIGLAVHARVLSEPRQVRRAAPVAAPAAEEEMETLLAVAGDRDVRMAIPLAQVTRLEEFPCASIERLGDRDVVPYRAESLRLVDVSDLLSGRASRRRTARRAQDGTVKAVVYSGGGVQIGIVVRQILDTVTHRVVDEIPGGRVGVRGSAVIGGRVTEILDLDRLCGAWPEHLRPGSVSRGVAV